MSEEIGHLSEVTNLQGLEGCMTPYPITQNHFLMIQGIRLKGKTVQLLEDNTEHVTSGSVLTNHKTKIHKFTYIKIKIFCSSKDAIHAGGHTQLGENICKMNYPQRAGTGLYKELLQISFKR